MSYHNALEAAGAQVLAYQSFGSYQGDWYALVVYNGMKGWVTGSYGSCSGCDAFECEFSSHYDRCDDHWINDPNCTICQEKRVEYQVRLSGFGKGYLDNILTQEEIEQDAARNLAWDIDAQSMVDFVKSYASVIAK